MARPNKPWYRAGKEAWYVKVNGKQRSLGVRGKENARAAKEAWHRLMAGGKNEVRRAEKEPSVSELIGLFLADCQGRVKEKTLRGYRDFLQPFATKCHNLKAAALTPTLAEQYSRKPAWSPSTRH